MYQAITAAPPHVRIAASRLHDSERRNSPVDALIDAVIGLEVLLNPMDNKESSFRIALNYAFLGPEAERHDRYERFKEIQKMRGMVLHSGVNMQSKYASDITLQAKNAKEALRETLNEFMFNPTFLKRGKLKADFWTTLVMPLPDNSAASDF